MQSRSRSSILLAFLLLFIYLAFWRDGTPFQNGSHSIDVLKSSITHEEGQEHEHEHEQAPLEPAAEPLVDIAPEPTHSAPWAPVVSKAIQEALRISSLLEAGTMTGSAAVPKVTFFADGKDHKEETVSKQSAVESAGVESSVSSSSVEPAATEVADGKTGLQARFEKEYDALGSLESAGAIYGSTLNRLVSAGTHAGFHATALTSTESWTPYSDAPPLAYNPYPAYNSTAWSASHVGTYAQCDGPDGPIKDVLVFSGHPETFDDPALGSFVPLGIDTNLCFEREARLGAYGYEDGEPVANSKDATVRKRTDWEAVDWRVLQEKCVEKNADRFVPVTANVGSVVENRSNSSAAVSNVTAEVEKRDLTEAEAKEEGLHGMPEVKATVTPRTAVLLRAPSSKNYTENDMQNIRSLISELALRTGGEYTVYLMVKVSDESSPIWNNAREEAVKLGIPPEFQAMCIFWNENMMKEFYFKAPSTDNTKVSDWLPVQKFAADYPQFDFFWNWELDTRYTGHHYNLFEKLVTFAQAQPRKGLWERNERFYIPSVHGPYDTKFRTTVEDVSGKDTVWGAPQVTGIKAVGPVRASEDPKDDNYAWGVGEDADFISLAPIFNPVDTTWPRRNEIEGYDGEATPRRATIGMNSRCSAKLLKAMNVEDVRGNHIGSEMGPQTVALLHGLKAVAAPVPLFFDRAWNGTTLENYLNPGPKGVSGSCPNSPFGEGNEVRFEGSTWGEKAVVPRRLYNAWLGWEFRGFGGPEWEKVHGRVCLPPMLLRLISDVVKPLPDHAS